MAGALDAWHVSGPLRDFHCSDFLGRGEIVRERRVRCASLVCGSRWYGSLLLRSRISAREGATRNESPSPNAGLSDRKDAPVMMMLAPVLTPHGLLMLAQSLEAEEEALALEPERGSRLEKAFARGAGHGLLLLGADEVGT